MLGRCLRSCLTLPQRVRRLGRCPSFSASRVGRLRRSPAIGQQFLDPAVGVSFSLEEACVIIRESHNDILRHFNPNNMDAVLLGLAGSIAQRPGCRPVIVFWYRNPDRTESPRVPAAELLPVRSQSVQLIRTEAHQATYRRNVCTRIQATSWVAQWHREGYRAAGRKTASFRVADLAVLRAGQQARRARETLPRASLGLSEQPGWAGAVEQTRKHRPEAQPVLSQADSSLGLSEERARRAALPGHTRPESSRPGGLRAEWVQAASRTSRTRCFPPRVTRERCLSLLFSHARGERFVWLVRLQEMFINPSFLVCLARQSASLFLVTYA